MMAGTEIMTVAESRRDGSAHRYRRDRRDPDRVGQKAKLEVDAFRDRKFHGTVTEIANSAKGLSSSPQSSSSSSSAGGSSQEATKFEVKIRIQEKEIFRPGMSVTGGDRNPLSHQCARRADPKRHNAHAQKRQEEARTTRPKRRGPQRWRRNGKSETKKTRGSRFCPGKRVCEDEAGEARHQRRQLRGNHRRGRGGPGSHFRRLQGHQSRAGGRAQRSRRAIRAKKPKRTKSDSVGSFDL